MSTIAKRGRTAPAPAPTDHQIPLFSDDLLARLRHVVLSSRRMTMAGLTGEHRSLRKGMSPEFTDFKPYTEGDDFRRVDWNAYARSDELVVRESETTTEFDVHILADASRSMDWSSTEGLPTKLRHGLRIAGALGYLSLWHFDRLTMTPLGASAGRGFGPVQGRSNIVPMLRYLERVRSQGQVLVPQAIGRYVHMRRRPGMLVLISDFLSDEPAEYESVMHGAASRGWQTVLLQVFDPVEDDPGAYFDSALTTELRGMEGGERLRIRGDRVSVEQYREARQEWLDAVATLGTHVNAMHVPIDTSQPVDDIVLRLMRMYGLVTR